SKSDEEKLFDLGVYLWASLALEEMLDGVDDPVQVEGLGTASEESDLESTFQNGALASTARTIARVMVATCSPMVRRLLDIERLEVDRVGRRGGLPVLGELLDLVLHVLGLLVLGCCGLLMLVVHAHAGVG
ncbi:hypothetical protein FRC17_008021, partial [Serendipita sp. 399]